MEDHTPEALKRARKLRREMTLPEVLLWRLLKGKPMGVKFRKQHPVGDFIVDFYCAEKRVGIEIDGIAHDMGDNPHLDICRDAFLKSMGVDIVRIPAPDVLRDVDAAADSIVRYCANRPPPSAAGAAATSPRGGGFLGAHP
jgi:very-short-patch-repair endonuclease